MLKDKYVELGEELERRVKAGVYADKLPGVFRLAEEFGVSHITVTKAVKRLAARGYVTRMGTKGAVLNAAAPARPRTNIVCVVGGADESVKNSSIAKIISADAEEAGYRSILLTAHQREVLRDSAFMDAFHVDGFIFIYNSLTSDIVNTLRGTGVPFVSMTWMPDDTGVSWVDHDNAGGLAATLAAFHALGHRRIALLGLLNQNEGVQGRLSKAYKDFMVKRKIHDAKLFALDFDLRPDTSDPEAAQAAYCRNKTREFLNLPNPPTALYTNSLPCCRAIAGELAALGARVPEDVSLVVSREEFEPDPDGFSYLWYSEERRAKEAFRALRELIDNPAAGPVRRFLERKLVGGKSLAARK